MKPLNKAGFTIVETMLFLGISGLLVMGILVGTGSSINVQRYRDSVSSFRSFLQQQYSDVANISNEGALNDCYGDGTTDNARGQSDCVILGRFIKSSDSKSVNIENVIGYLPSNETSSNDDVQSLQDYNIKTSPVESDTYDIEWGSSLKQLNGDDMKFSILILRSTTSGVIRTFIDNENDISSTDLSAFRELVDADLLKNSATICVDSSGLLTGGTRMAVRINANATGASSVETLGDNSGCN